MLACIFNIIVYVEYVRIICIRTIQFSRVQMTGSYVSPCKSVCKCLHAYLYMSVKRLVNFYVFIRVYIKEVVSVKNFARQKKGYNKSKKISPQTISLSYIINR